MSEPIKQLHQQAVLNKQLTYLDPNTGYAVFTAYALKQRKKCCGCGCRHCPYIHENVPRGREKFKPFVPTLINASSLVQEECDVLFWSGGKDSYLALLQLLDEGAQVILLTTFDRSTGVVAHQEIEFKYIIEQSRHLNLPLLGVPLYSGEYTSQLTEGLKLLSTKTKLKRLVFGDLHLEHIRRWREKQLKGIAEQLSMKLYFPLWKAEYDVLMQRFLQSGAQATITAAPFGSYANTVHVGASFDEQFISNLSSTVDSFGENGEFHTRVWWPKSHASK